MNNLSDISSLLVFGILLITVTVGLCYLLKISEVRNYGEQKN